MIDLHQLNIGSSIWYKGRECIVTHLGKTMDASVNFPSWAVTWTICLQDVDSYNATFLGLPNTSNKDPIYTGNTLWDTVCDECTLGNAIKFIREP